MAPPGMRAVRAMRPVPGKHAGCSAPRRTSAKPGALRSGHRRPVNRTVTGKGSRVGAASSQYVTPRPWVLGRAPVPSARRGTSSGPGGTSFTSTGRTTGAAASTPPAADVGSPAIRLWRAKGGGGGVTAGGAGCPEGAARPARSGRPHVACGTGVQHGRGRGGRSPPATGAGESGAPGARLAAAGSRGHRFTSARWTQDRGTCGGSRPRSAGWSSTAVLLSQIVGPGLVQGGTRQTDLEGRRVG